ncbi:MAG TPA: hypothetical protein VFA26_00635, partial [Gemmataceae bacterium]|nr:hypothetical protein [Gemmataceae bacterium]
MLRWPNRATTICRVSITSSSFAPARGLVHRRPRLTDRGSDQFLDLGHLQQVVEDDFLQPLDP